VGGVIIMENWLAESLLEEVRKFNDIISEIQEINEKMYELLNKKFGDK
jgi:hypothetical protein